MILKGLDTACDVARGTMTPLSMTGMATEPFRELARRSPELDQTAIVTLFGRRAYL